MRTTALPWAWTGRPGAPPSRPGGRKRRGRTGPGRTFSPSSTAPGRAGPTTCASRCPETTLRMPAWPAGRDTRTAARSTPFPRTPSRSRRRLPRCWRSPGRWRISSPATIPWGPPCPASTRPRNTGTRRSAISGTRRRKESITGPRWRARQVRRCSLPRP